MFGKFYDFISQLPLPSNVEMKMKPASKSHTAQIINLEEYRRKKRRRTQHPQEEPIVPVISYFLLWL